MVQLVKQTVRVIRANSRKNFTVLQGLKSSPKDTLLSVRIIENYQGSNNARNPTA